jgi:hypothetical protein
MSQVQHDISIGDDGGGGGGGGGGGSGSPQADLPVHDISISYEYDSDDDSDYVVKKRTIDTDEGSHELLRDQLSLIVAQPNSTNNQDVSISIRDNEDEQATSPTSTTSNNTNSPPIEAATPANTENFSLVCNTGFHHHHHHSLTMPCACFAITRL